MRWFENAREFELPFMKINAIFPQLSRKLSTNRNDLLKYSEGVKDKVAHIEIRTPEMTSQHKKEIFILWYEDLIFGNCKI